MTTASFTPARTGSVAAAARPFTLRMLLDVMRCAFEMKDALGVDNGVVSQRTVAKLRRIATRM